MGVVKGMILKAAESTCKFCDNPACVNHVDVDRGCRQIMRDGKRVRSHDYIKGRNRLFFCDACKQAIMMA